MFSENGTIFTIMEQSMLVQLRQIQSSTVSANRRKQPSFTASVEFLQKTVEYADGAYKRPFNMLAVSLQNAILKQRTELERAFPTNFQIVIGEAVRNEEIGFDSGHSKDIFSVYVKFREAVVEPLKLWTPSGLIGMMRGKKTRLAGKWQELPLIDYFEQEGKNSGTQLKNAKSISIKKAIRNYIKTAQSSVSRQQKIDEANVAAEQHAKIIQALNGRSSEEIEAEMAEIEALLRNDGSDKAFAVLQKLYDMGFLRDPKEYNNRLPQATTKTIALLPAISAEK